MVDLRIQVIVNLQYLTTLDTNRKLFVHTWDRSVQVRTYRAQYTYGAQK
jgi:hypothetical protein